MSTSLRYACNEMLLIHLESSNNQQYSFSFVALIFCFDVKCPFVKSNIEPNLHKHNLRYLVFIRFEMKL